jgi:hypothetical protein
VYEELVESIQKLKKKAKSQLLKKLAKTLQTIASGASVQRVGTTSTSESEEPIQRVVAPEITTTNDPTSEKALRTKPRTHQRITRRNTPGKLPNIVPTAKPANRTSPRLNRKSETPIETVTCDGEDGKNDATINTIRDRFGNTKKHGCARKPNGKRTPVRIPNFISQEAINYVSAQCYNDTGKTWTPDNLLVTNEPQGQAPYDVNIEHYCAPVVHPVTGETITQYKKLAKDPLLKDIWETGLGKEVGRMAQGDIKTGTKGTDSIFVMTHAEITNIPRDRIVTYCRLVVDFRPQKEDPNRVRMTAGGNLLQYPGELTTRTADLTTSKIIWNSVLSTEGA